MIEAIRTVFDPEIPVNIYELGLVYDIEFPTPDTVHVRMTLTSPNCPEAESIPPTVKGKVEGVAGVKGATVDIVWEPTWNPNMMSEAAKLELGMI